MSSKETCKRGKSQEEADGRGRSKRTKTEEGEEGENEHGTDSTRREGEQRNAEENQKPNPRRLNKLQACVRLARLARRYGITDNEARKMVVEENLSLQAFEDRYIPDLSLSAFDRLVVEVGMWRAGVVAAARRAWVEGGGGVDGSSFVPPAPRRPKSNTNEGGVGVRVDIERKRQLGQKLDRKVQPKRSAGDLARLTEALEYPPGAEWWDLDEAFEQLVVEVREWRAGVVDAARRAWVEGGGGVDGSSFVPPAPRRPRRHGNEGGVGVRVDIERKRQLGQKLDRKVQPKRSAGDLARLTEALGYPPGTDWWSTEDLFDQLVEDVRAWRAGIVDAARRAWVEGGGGVDGSLFVPPAPRRPKKHGNEGGVGRRVDNERMRQLGTYKVKGKVQPVRSADDLARLTEALGYQPGTDWWSTEDLFDQLVQDVREWRAGVVGAARRAWEEGGGGVDGSSFVPPAPRRPRRRGNECGVGVRVDNERMRQLGTYKVKGKVQPVRSADDLARLTEALGYPPGTEWWDLDEAFEQLVEDVREWRAGVVDAARRALVGGGGGVEGSSFVPPLPRRPKSTGNEGGVGRRVDDERKRQLGTYKVHGKLQPKRSAADLSRLTEALGYPSGAEWWDLDEAFEKLVEDVRAWRAGVVGAARRAWEEGGGDVDGSSFVPPAPRRPRSNTNEGGVGNRVDIERKRQLGTYKVKGKVQPVRSADDLARLTEALGYQPGTDWWSTEDLFDQLVQDVRAWRAGVVDAARRAWVEGGDGADGSLFVPPAPRRPKKHGNEGGVGRRVDIERKRQLGQKLNGKVQPKRSADDLARLTEALGYPPGTEWWR